MSIVADGAPQAAVKKRMLRIASGCATREAFVSVFKRFCDRESIFIATRTPKPAGADLQFSITLADGAPLISGVGSVLESWTDETSPYGRAGMKIRFDGLTPSGQALVDELVAANKADERARSSVPIPSAAAALAALAKAGPPPIATAPKAMIKPLPSVIPKPGDLRNQKTMLGMAPLKRPPKLEATPAPIAIPQIARDVEVKLPPPPRPPRPTPTDTDEQPTGVATKPGLDSGTSPGSAWDESSWDEAASHVLGETRVKGSDLVLPANPLGGVESESLDAFVECTLYEETGGFSVDSEATTPGEGPDDWQKDDLTIPPWLQGPVGEGLPPLDSMAVPPPLLPIEPAPHASERPPALPAARQTASDLRSHLVDAGKAFDPARVPASEPILKKSSRGHWPLTIVIAAATGLAGVAIGAFALGGGEDEEPAATPPRVASAVEPPAAPAPVEAVADAAPPPSAEVVEPSAGEEPAAEPPAEVPVAEPPPAEPPAGDLEFSPLAGKLGKERCGAEIRSRPDHAQVFIGRTHLGDTPLRVVLPCGEHALELRRPRYADLAKTIDLERGKLDTLDLQMARPEHRLRITSTPGGAEVKVNGRPAGTTPATVTVSGFETARIEVSLAGYKSWSTRLYVRHSTASVSAKLSAGKAAAAKPGKPPRD
jgi:hypothetical protein